MIVLRFQAAGGLCCLLTNPYPEQKPIIPFREMEVPRESVKITKELGGGFFGRVYAGLWVLFKIKLENGLITQIYRAIERHRKLYQQPYYC